MPQTRHLGSWAAGIFASLYMITHQALAENRVSIQLAAGGAAYFPKYKKKIDIYADKFSVEQLALKFAGTGIAVEMGTDTGEPAITLSVDGFDALYISGNIDTGDITSIETYDIYHVDVVDPYGSRLGSAMSSAVGKTAKCYDNNIGEVYCIHNRKPGLRYKEGDIDNPCKPPISAPPGGKLVNIPDCATIGIIEMTTKEPGR